MTKKFFVASKKPKGYYSVVPFETQDEAERFFTKIYKLGRNNEDNEVDDIVLHDGGRLYKRAVRGNCCLMMMWADDPYCNAFGTALQGLMEQEFGLFLHVEERGRRYTYPTLWGGDTNKVAVIEHATLKQLKSMRLALFSLVCQHKKDDIQIDVRVHDDDIVPKGRFTNYSYPKGLNIKPDRDMEQKFHYW